jgi:multidrug efflux pump subunit AcrA (membrane-fusion protein)
MRHLFLLSLLIFILSACNNNSEKIKPRIETVSESVYASGVIKSKDQYQVYAMVNGLVDKIYLAEGDSVEPGTVLLSISNEASRLNTENAKLAADFADVDANSQKLKELKLAINLSELKKRNDSLLYIRQQKLWEDKIGTKVELEQRELAFRNSQTAFESAVLRYNDLIKQVRFSSDQSKKNLSISRTFENDYLIKSKIKGKVYSILKEPGEMVSPQIPLAIIGDANDFIIELQVDEYDIVRLETGQKVYLTLDSYKDELFEAVLTKINPLMNERSKTFTVEAAFVEQPKVMYPNLTLEATILIQTKKDALTIPRNYIFGDDYVMKGNGEKVKVVIGIKDYQKAEILSGISKDDELILPEN